MTWMKLLPATLYKIHISTTLYYSIYLSKAYLSCCGNNYKKAYGALSCCPSSWCHPVVLKNDFSRRVFLQLGFSCLNQLRGICPVLEHTVPRAFRVLSVVYQEKNRSFNGREGGACNAPFCALMSLKRRCAQRPQRGPNLLVMVVITMCRVGISARGDHSQSIIYENKYCRQDVHLNRNAFSQRREEPLRIRCTKKP